MKPKFYKIIDSYFGKITNFAKYFTKTQKMICKKITTNSQIIYSAIHIEILIVITKRNATNRKRNIRI